MKRKERRHWRFDCVAKQANQFDDAANAATTARREQQPVASRDFPIAEFQFEPAFASRTRFLDTFASEKPNAGVLGFVDQTIDDRFRRICYWKHSAVLFPFESDAARFKPGKRILRRKSVEWRNEFSLAARISLGEVARIEQRMRHIATTASRNPHLGKKLRAAFEERDPATWIGLRGCDRRKKTSGAATDNRDFSHSLTYGIRKAGKEEADRKFLLERKRGCVLAHDSVESMQMNWRLLTIINGAIALVTVSAVIFDVTTRSPAERGRQSVRSQPGRTNSQTPQQVEEKRVEHLDNFSQARVDNMAAVPSAELTQLMARAKPEELAALADKFNDAPTDARTLGALGVFFQAWAELDPKASLIGAFSLKDVTSRKLAAGTVVSCVSPSAAPELIAYLSEHPDKDLLDECKNRFLNPLLSNWSDLDPDSAAKFMDDLGDAKSNLNYTARNSIAFNWGTLDPTAALEWVEKQKDKDYVNRDSLYNEVIRGWCLKDIAAAAAYVREHLDHPAAQTAADSVAENLFSHHPEDATEWISHLPEGEVRDDAESTIATMWAEKDPASTAKWLAILPENEQKNLAYTIAQTWSAKNWPEASRWIDSLTGDARDNALRAAVNREGATEAESLSLALAIRDPEMQSTTMENVIRNWASNDAQAAEAWVNGSPLSDEQRQKLLSVISDAKEAASAERVIVN
jgi:hypothetical protein